MFTNGESPWKTAKLLRKALQLQLLYSGAQSVVFGQVQSAPTFTMFTNPCKVLLLLLRPGLAANQLTRELQAPQVAQNLSRPKLCC